MPKSIDARDLPWPEPWPEVSLVDQLASALRDLTHYEGCSHRWCEAGRAALARYDAERDRTGASKPNG